jgi:hypothetical protein
MYDNYMRRNYLKLSVDCLRQKFLNLFKIWKVQHDLKKVKAIEALIAKYTSCLDMPEALDI